MSIIGIGFMVISILRNRSSYEFPLSQSEISMILEKERGLRADRRTLRRILDELVKCETGVKSRQLKGRIGEPRIGWYLESGYSVKEVMFLTESLYFDPYIDNSAREILLEKLSQDIGVSKIHKGIVNTGWRKDSEENETILSLVDKAVTEHNMLTFSLKLIKRGGSVQLERDECGRVREYLVRPFSTVLCGGKYYLLGALGDRESVNYYPFDRMYGVALSGVFYRACPINRADFYPVNEAEAARPSCVGGREEITVRADISAWPSLFSAFPDAEELRHYGGKSEIRFVCNLNSAKHYLLQFGGALEVLSPARLRRAVYEEVKVMQESYRAMRGRSNDAKNA